MKYEVGKPVPGLRVPLQPGVTFTYDRGEYHLLMILDQVKSPEIKAVRKGPCEFALTPMPPALFLLYRFPPDIFWSDSSYSWMLQREHASDLDIPAVPDTPETRILLTITLVRAETGVVEALRAVTWSPEFSQAINKAIRDQAEGRVPWPGVQGYFRFIDEIYRKYTTSDLLQRASIRCRGGD